MQNKFTFIQISDTHINAKRETDWGVKPAVILAEAVKDIKKTFPGASFVVHTGDVGQMGIKDDYDLYKSLVKDLGMPMYHVRGNHDYDSDMFREVIAGKKDGALHWNFNLNNWHFIGLDCDSKDMNSRQKMSTEEMNWLHRLLLDNADCPAFLFLHSHFHPVHSPKLDDLMLENYDQFREILSGHKCIRCVVIGHLHHATAHFSQYVTLSPPSLFWQFMPMVQEIKKDDASVLSGYRVFEIDNSDTICTYIRRLSIPPRNEFPVIIDRCTAQILNNLSNPM